MTRSGLEPSERPSAPLAAGYVLRHGGLEPVGQHDVPAVGGGGIYSTGRDMASYVAALLSGGGTVGGRLLQAATVEEMFSPQFQPDPRIPGMGLGFWRGNHGSHRIVGHDGTVSGFLSAITLAPDDNVGVVVLANTGGLDGRGAPLPLADALLRRLLGLPDDQFPADLPAHPGGLGRHLWVVQPTTWAHDEPLHAPRHGGRGRGQGQEWEPRAAATEPSPRPERPHASNP